LAALAHETANVDVSAKWVALNVTNVPTGPDDGVTTKVRDVAAPVTLAGNGPAGARATPAGAPGTRGAGVPAEARGGADAGPARGGAAWSGAAGTGEERDAPPPGVVALWEAAIPRVSDTAPERTMRSPTATAEVARAVNPRG
jgi:hypothetical protein